MSLTVFENDLKSLIFKIVIFKKKKFAGKFNIYQCNCIPILARKFKINMGKLNETILGDFRTLCIQLFHLDF